MNKYLNGTGHTLIEVLVVSGIMVLIGSGAVAIVIASASTFDNTTTEAFTDTDAVLAMQMIVSDVREAKSVSILDNGGTLRVLFPLRTYAGYYDRHVTDAGSRVDYYVSDQTGVRGLSGRWLWRARTSGAMEVLRNDVVDVTFEQDTSRSVKITIIVENDAASGPKRTELTERVVYLRNY